MDTQVIVEDGGHWRHTTPNYLTLIRLIIAGWIAFAILLAATLSIFGIIDSLIVLKESLLIATIAATFAFITDFLDGWWVRKWPQTGSVWGKKWDPIADKSAVVAFLAYLFAADVFVFGLEFETALVMIIMLREMGISWLREAVGHERVPVVRGGKWKTTLQMSAMVFYGLLNYLPSWAAEGIRWLDYNVQDADISLWIGCTALSLLFIATCLTVVTGLGYVRPFLLQAYNNYWVS